MRVAVLSDIHANLVALRAVLSEVKKAGIDRLVLLGDHIGYYYQPKEVIAELSDWDCAAILGNHDRMILEGRRDRSVRETYHSRYGSGLEVALEELGAAEWRWLESQPLQQTIELGEQAIHLAHGAPFDDDAYVYPDADAARLAMVREAVDVDAIWLGHTHWPFLAHDKPIIANPGSVGQPRDIGGLASWAIFDADTRSMAFRRTEFETSELVAECIARDPQLSGLRDVLLRNRISR